MKERPTKILRGATAWRYAKTLRRDVSFALSGKMLLRLLGGAVVLFLLVGAAGHGWARVYEADSHGGQTWREFVFGLLGAVDAEPDGVDPASFLYSAFVRLAGAVVVGGVITSFFCALAERFAEMKLRGLLVPVLRDHFVVVGSGAMADDLVRALLAPDSAADDLARWAPQERTDAAVWAREVSRRRILLCTGGDVEELRETLDAVLPRGISSRIVYAYGETESGSGPDGLCETLRLEDARQVYVLGDEGTAASGDVGNLAFAKEIGDYLERKRRESPDALPIPVFVRLDGGASFDFVKKISFETVPTAGKTLDRVTSFFKPFGFTEGWARRIWGEAADAPDAGPLDFAPMGPGTSVHLVVAGLSPMGEALVLEAVRVCHYPDGGPTRITVVDRDSAAGDAFFSRHPSLRGVLPDIRIEFLAAGIESEAVRALLREAASDEKRLLTVAVCLQREDDALSAALNLPEEVYWHRSDGSGKDIRATYPEHGARIWVFQEHRKGLLEGAVSNPRYGNLRPFGMQENCFAPWCLREFCAMYLNAVYAWPDAGPGGGAEARKDRLLATLADGGDAAVRRFQEFAFREYVLLKPELRWANLYVSDFYGTVFRSLGLRAVCDRDAPFAELARENDRLFSEARSATVRERSLAETEHNRWMADRALMGYRPPRPGTGEKRDDAFRYHNDMVPFGDLPPDEAGKDELSIACIPLFMALQGIRLEKAI